MALLKTAIGGVCLIGALTCFVYFVASSYNGKIAEQPVKIFYRRDDNVISNFREKGPHQDNQITDTTPPQTITGVKQPRILCWIKTNPNNIATKATAIKLTWGRRCDITLYMSSVSEPTLPAIGLNVSEGRDFLTDKAMRAFHYVYEHYINDADWFFASDDDTYAIIENLRHFVSDKDPKTPIYYGHHFKAIVKQGYSSGGSGYVLSHEALKRLGKHGYDPKLKCELVRGADDVEIGQCLEKLNVVLGDSRDKEGRSRFHCFDPETHVIGRYPDWYLKYDNYGAKKDFISDYAITFHYVSPQQMRTLDYLIYHLRPFASFKDKVLRVLDKPNKTKNNRQEQDMLVTDVIKRTRNKRSIQ